MLDQKVQFLCGAEKVRFSFCKFVVTPSTLPILDGPTNQLDIPSKEMLEEATSEYTGTETPVSQRGHNTQSPHHHLDREDEVDNFLLKLSARTRAGLEIHRWYHAMATCLLETVRLPGRGRRRHRSYRAHRDGLRYSRDGAATWVRIPWTAELGQRVRMCRGVLKTTRPSEQGWHGQLS